MKYLLALNIGPVQDFIISARRSRDLWFGSWLLSEISKAAAKKIHDEGGVLIFPSPLNLGEELEPDSVFIVANKVVAEVETSGDVQSLCAQIYDAMLTRLRKIKSDAFKDLEIHSSKADAQINDLIEFYWAASPFDKGGYQLVRKKTEALLAARKATRNFKHVTWGGDVPKSSLDGQRESVIDEEVFRRLNDNNLTEGQKANIERTLRIQYGVRGKERLCGVSLLKRRGKPIKNGGGIDSFFSTSHVAALPLLNRLKNKKAVETYLNKLKELLDISDYEVKSFLGHIPKNATLKPHKLFCNEDGSLLYDGHLLFKERLHEFFPEEDKCKKAKEALSMFLKEVFATKDNPNPSPRPYYAILQADGDHMGAVIEAQANPQHHQKLSQALSGFAVEAEQIVEKDHDGSCIYAGGDDVLALLPLHTVLQCARKLSDKFKETLNDFKDGEGKVPTLSVGIAIGHHLDPLQETLNLAREAEKVAKREVPNKETPEKNALAITLSKRSGADRTVKGSWDNKPEGALEYRLNRFAFLLLKDELPDGAAFELHDLALRLNPTKDATNAQNAILLEAQQVEAKRILKRKQPKQGSEKKLAAKILNEFCGSTDKSNGDYQSGFIDKVDLENWRLENLADEIIVAREFAGSIKQADMEKEFEQVNGFVDERKE